MEIKKASVIEWGSYDENDNFIDPVLGGEHITHYKVTYEENGAIKTVVIDKYKPTKRKFKYEGVLPIEFKDSVKIV